MYITLKGSLILLKTNFQCIQIYLDHSIQRKEIQEYVSDIYSQINSQIIWKKQQPIFALC